MKERVVLRLYSAVRVMSCILGLVGSSPLGKYIYEKKNEKNTQSSSWRLFIFLKKCKERAYLKKSTLSYHSSPKLRAYYSFYLLLYL